ncbi:Kunitz inhibitor ST1-like protein [Artemisia annua]|uniref:Kunitz inhibitor ST1-like protein n=1 Tax=Artemisia annua TaxID=35608 RepID=A0A2U1ME80_ARTAN|nr:Kunitz inhibitor ST1-like protein [Artemisia annua]
MKESFFIFIVLSTLLSLSLSQTPPPVLDTDGNIVRSGTNYYILPVVNDKGGGVTLAPRKDNPCPYDVAQDNNRQRNGLPMNFVPAYTFKEDMIRESSDLNIRFAGAGKCIPTPVWRVEYDENGIGYVSSHGMVGLIPGRDSIRNWFKIEKFEKDYKIVYCPSVVTTFRPTCSDIGSTISKNGSRTLVFSKAPLKVKFKKA